ncbi:MAG TPA: HAD family hydrolase [Dehalococcoidia bacterium]|jgi:FMN phosphatase YigB (HAD superfamily)|nr:HAD family hydrolase [Dehalococcoidia bacterium]
MPPRSAVLFDLDNTLVSINTAFAERLTDEAWAKAIRIRPDLSLELLRATHQPVVIDVWRQAEADIIARAPGSIDGLKVIYETFRKTLEVAGCDDESVARVCFESYWARSRGGGIFSIYEDVVETLEMLRGTCSLAVITNGPCITQRDKLEVLGLDTYFDVIVCSGDVGAAKPDPAIFEYVLHELGCTAADSIHVGDSLIADVAGANWAGIKSVWLNRGGAVREESDPKPDYEINSLGRLPMIAYHNGSHRRSPGRAPRSLA